jgi:hypothetical protein
MRAVVVRRVRESFGFAFWRSVPKSSGLSIDVSCDYYGIVILSLSKDGLLHSSPFDRLRVTMQTAGWDIL